MNRAIKIFSLFVLFLLISGFASDDKDSDSLKTRLALIRGNSDNEVREKVDILNKLGYFDFVYHTHSRLDSLLEDCLVYCNKALKLSEKVSYDYGKGMAMQSLGYAYGYLEKTDSAILLLQSAEEIFLQLNDKKELATTVANHLYVCFFNGDDEQASIYFDKAMNLYSEIEDYIRPAIIYERLAISRRQSKLEYSVVKFFKIALDYRKKAGVIVDMALPLTHIGEFYLTDLNNPDSALFYCLEALNYINTSNQKYLVHPSDKHYNGNIYSWTMQIIGDCYKDLNEYQQALKSYALVEELLDHDNPDELSFLIPTKTSVAEIYLVLGDYQHALEEIRHSEKLFYKLDNQSFGLDERLVYQSNIHRISADIYEKLGDYENALYQYILYTSWLDTLQFFNYQQNRLKFHEESYAAEREMENEVLKKDLAIQKLKQDKQELNNLLLLTSLGLAIIILAFVYYQFRLKKRMNKHLEIKIGEALKQQNQQQQIIIHQAGLTSLGEMAAGIAHEAKVPIQNILFATESIQQEESKDFKDREFFNKMISEIYMDINKLNKLIEHIQVFSSQQKTEFLEDFSINDAIQNALSMMKVKLADLHIDLQLELKDNLPMVKGNTYKFEQVIVNIINNARDAIEYKYAGKSPAEGKSIKIKTLQDNRSLIIEIIDSGIGIKEDNLVKIFHPFFTTKELGKGTGLGLSISYGLIKEMNGTINVISNYNEGTSFKITLPL